jgi:phosphate/sulfate permease
VAAHDDEPCCCATTDLRELRVILALAFDSMNGFHDATNSTAGRCVRWCAEDGGLHRRRADARLLPGFTPIAAGSAAAGDASPPVWAIGSCYPAIGMGTPFGRWRLVGTMGQCFSKFKPIGGSCVETGSAPRARLATSSGLAS